MGAWLVVGGSRGLGCAIATEALVRDERVAVSGRGRENLEELTAHYGDAVLPVQLDVIDPDAVLRTVAVIEGWRQGIDVLVNCAGHGLHGAIEEIDDAEAQAIFDTNVFGLLRVTRAVLPGMRARRAGIIVNMSSVAGLSAGAGSGLYSATKFAVEAISESLRDELAPLGIRVLLVEPGAFRTEFASRSIRRAKTSISDYVTTAGARAAQIRANGGHEPGDPARGAKLIVDAIQSADAPFRLLLGTRAHERTKVKLAGLRADMERTEANAAFSDFPAESG